MLPVNEQLMKMIPEDEETDNDDDDIKFDKSLRVSGQEYNMFISIFFKFISVLS